MHLLLQLNVLSRRTECHPEAVWDVVLDIQLSLACHFRRPCPAHSVFENARAQPETSVAVKHRALSPITIQDLRVRIVAERALWRTQECEEARRCNVVDHCAVIKSLQAAQRELKNCMQTQSHVISMTHPLDTVCAHTDTCYLNVLIL